MAMSPEEVLLTTMAPAQRAFDAYGQSKADIAKMLYLQAAKQEEARVDAARRLEAEKSLLGMREQADTNRQQAYLKAVTQNRIESEGREIKQTLKDAVARAKAIDPKFEMNPALSDEQNRELANKFIADKSDEETIGAIKLHDKQIGGLEKRIKTIKTEHRNRILPVLQKQAEQMVIDSNPELKAHFDAIALLGQQKNLDFGHSVALYAKSNPAGMVIARKLAEMKPEIDAALDNLPKEKALEINRLQMGINDLQQTRASFINRNPRVASKYLGSADAALRTENDGAAAPVEETQSRADLLKGGQTTTATTAAPATPGQQWTGVIPTMLRGSNEYFDPLFSPKAVVGGIADAAGVAANAGRYLFTGTPQQPMFQNLKGTFNQPYSGGVEGFPAPTPDELAVIGQAKQQNPNLSSEEALGIIQQLRSRKAAATLVPWDSSTMMPVPGM